MMEKYGLKVREIEQRDINLIADYWTVYDPEFMVSMGVDLNKLPTRKEVTAMLNNQINTSLNEKNSYALIWELNGKQVGHSNVNNIEFGQYATMHLHLWNHKNRLKGLGTELVKNSLAFYFNRLKIELLICEPYALNPAPNKTLKKVGFQFIKTYRTIPGSSNFEQEVNRWEMTRECFEML